MHDRPPAPDGGPVPKDVSDSGPCPRAGALASLARQTTQGPRPFLAIGVLLLLTWAVWWGVSVARPLPQLWPGPAFSTGDRATNILIWPFIGADFQHNYAAVNSWLVGYDPYVAIAGDPMNLHYVYPPLTLFAFSWTGWFPPHTVHKWVRYAGGVNEHPFPYCLPAVFLWMTAIVLVALLAAWRSWRVRQGLHLADLPLPFVLGFALISYPMMFELERGNCDVLPLLALALLVPALARRHRLSGDLFAALCVAFATGIKAYPGILILGLLVLRRFRAAALSAALLVVQVLVLWHPFREWFAIVHHEGELTTPSYMFFSHSLIVHWKLMWASLGLPGLSRIPAQPVVGALVLAMVLTVSWKVFRSRAGPELAWPYLLWLTTMGTLANVVAQDYSLIYLPFALLAVWDPRDPWPVQLALLPMIAWWLPLFIGLDGLPLLLVKVAGIFLVGCLVIRRTRAAGEDASPTPAGSPVPAR